MLVEGRDPRGRSGYRKGYYAPFYHLDSLKHAVVQELQSGCAGIPIFEVELSPIGEWDLRTFKRGGCWLLNGTISSNYFKVQVLLKITMDETGLVSVSLLWISVA